MKPRLQPGTQTGGSSAPTLTDEPAAGIPSPGPGLAASPDFPPAEPGRYEVRGEFARGGLGRIVEVYDHRLGRTIAVKEILRLDGLTYCRFTREALLTARLQHPAIVPVHEIASWPTGEPFYSMKLVNGRSLSEHIKDARSLDARLSLLPNAIAVADAIAYAHSQGVIHRDIKPANVLVGDFGETVVIDWGLAKLVHEDDERWPAATRQAIVDSDLTMFGAVVGTPQYMAPEQAAGQAVDTRADVYALGALLFEVLAGEPPYTAPTGEEVLKEVRAKAPPPLDALQPRLPPDLVAIVHKAMAREPAARYPTARELVEDLRRFQQGRMVAAYRYSGWELVRRWLGKHRAAVAVAAAALVIVAGLAVVGVARIVTERDVARRRTNQLLLTEARGALERDTAEAVAWLRTFGAGSSGPTNGEDQAAVHDIAVEAYSRGVARHAPPSRGYLAFTADGRGFLGMHDGGLEIRDVGDGHVTARLPHGGIVDQVVAARDGRRIAILDKLSAAVVLHDLASGTQRTLSGHGAPIGNVAFSPDGRLVATGSQDATVRLWPAGGGEPRVLRPGAVASRVSFSGDGRWLLVEVAAAAPVRLYAVDGSEERALAEPFTIDNAAAVSPDGAAVALAGHDGQVALWPTRGTKLEYVATHRGRARAVAFSPDGRWLASAGEDGVVLLRDQATGQTRRLVGHGGAVTAVDFSPDSALVLSGGGDGEIRLWRLDGTADGVLGRAPGRIIRFDFSRDGRFVASVGADITARLWPLDAARLGRPLRAHTGDVLGLTFAPDGRTLASASADRTVRLWDIESGKSRVFPGHLDDVYRVAFTRDGRLFASAGYDGAVRLWDARAPDGAPPLRVLEGHKGVVWSLFFTPDDRRLVSAGGDGTIRLWNIVNGEPERVLSSEEGAVMTTSLSPDGRHLVAAGVGHTVSLWNLDDGSRRRLAGHRDRIHRVEYARDGSWLLTSSADQTLRRWSVTSGTSEILTRGIGPQPSVALAPDDRLLAVADADYRVWLQDTTPGATRRAIGRHRDMIWRMVFSPGGEWLASTSRDQTVRLWDARHGALEAILRHDAEASVLAFSPDGRYLATAGGADGVVRLWPMTPRVAIPREPAALRAFIARLSTAELAPDLRGVSP